MAKGQPRPLRHKRDTCYPYRMPHALIPRRGELAQTVRSLRGAPWYSLTVVIVMALGMALATTVFALVDRALFRPLPYGDVSRTYAVDPEIVAKPSAALQSPAAPIDVAAWTTAMPQAHLTAISSSVAWVGANEWVRSARVDASFADVFGLRPTGAGFQPDDFRAQMPVPPALISDSFWHRRFGGDPAVIGRTFTSDTGEGIRVVGVLPPGFVLPDAALPDVLLPRTTPDPAGRGRSLYVFARLPAGTSPVEAAARLSAASAAIARPGDYDAARLVPIREVLTASYAQTSWIVFWAAAALVLLACANIAGLSIGRLQHRRRDLALRRSLGASHGDLVRLLALEHGLLVVAGSIAGIWASQQLLAATLTLMPRYLLLDGATTDMRVIALAVATAAMCLVILTLFAARSAARSNARLTLAEGGATTGRRRSWILAAQVAIALVMMTGAALVAGSLLRVWGEDPGFAVERSAIVGVQLPAGSPATEIETFVADVRRVPGVLAAGGIDRPLVERAFNGSRFDAPPGVTATTIVESMGMTQGFLEASGLTRREGRWPRDDEFAAGEPVVVVSHTVARQYWPGAPALGRTLIADGRVFTVIGVVGDARYVSLDREPQGAIYYPLAALPRPAMRRMLVRFDAESSTRLPGLMQWIGNRCPRCAVDRSQTMTDAFAATIRPRRFYAWIFSSFAVAALVVVATGILGLVAMTSARRTREVGIRMALGATRAAVVRQFLREQSIAVGAGLAAGTAVSIWAVRFLESYMYKTPLSDSASWLAAIGTLAIVSLLATLVPALRSTRVDPARVLRES